jgi:AcrR family transcriptional regulator
MPGSRAPEEERRRQILAAAYGVAGEHGLAETTVLKVAAAAGVSPGLVLFHFNSRRELLLALLEDLLATTTVLRADLGIAQSLRRRSGVLADPATHRNLFAFAHVRLLMAGVRDVARNRLQSEFARYRDAFRPLAEAVLVAHPHRFPGVTADGLAGLSVSLIKGCAVQSMIDPDHFDVDEYFTAAVGLLAGAGSESTRA